MSALLRGPEAVHENECAAGMANAVHQLMVETLGGRARKVSVACTCGAALQQRILDDFWNSDLPSVRRVKRLCAMVDMIPGKENFK